MIYDIHHGSFWFYDIDYYISSKLLGLGNVICGLARLVFDTAKGEEFKAKIIPEGYEFGVAVLVGYPTEKEGEPHKADVTKIQYIG